MLACNMPAGDSDGHTDDKALKQGTHPNIKTLSRCHQKSSGPTKNLPPQRIFKQIQPS